MREKWKNICKITCKYTYNNENNWIPFPAQDTPQCTSYFIPCSLPIPLLSHLLFFLLLIPGRWKSCPRQNTCTQCCTWWSVSSSSVPPVPPVSLFFFTYANLQREQPLFTLRNENLILIESTVMDESGRHIASTAKGSIKQSLDGIIFESIRCRPIQVRIDTRQKTTFTKKIKERPCNIKKGLNRMCDFLNIVAESRERVLR